MELGDWMPTGNLTYVSFSESINYLDYKKDSRAGSYCLAPRIKFSRVNMQ